MVGGRDGTDSRALDESPVGATNRKRKNADKERTGIGQEVVDFAHFCAKISRW